MLSRDELSITIGLFTERGVTSKVSWAERKPKCKKKMNYPNKIIKVPALRVDRIQEMHICIGHILCEYLENKKF